MADDSQLGARRQLEGSWHLSCGRRDARDVRDGRCTELLDLRSHYGSQRKLLPLHELRLDQRLQLTGEKKNGGVRGFEPDLRVPWHFQLRFSALTEGIPGRTLASLLSLY